jgi:hypothetical protein
LAQLLVLALKRLDALALIGSRTGSQALVAFGLPHPVAQRLARAADLLGNRADRLLLGSVLALVVENHSNRSLAHLR